MSPVRHLHPLSSGQATPPSLTPAPVPASQTPANSQIYVGNQGYIHGIDGMLDQISGALVRQAMPIIQGDAQMQQNIGYAAGRALAKPLWVMAGIAAFYVGWSMYKSKPKTRSRRSRRSR
jgi:hypothetical protein